MALMTLNEVVSAESTADATMVARAHAYRAQASLGMGQPERARAAALLALKADSAIAITTPAFSTSIVALFEELRRPSSTANPEAAGRAAENSGRYQEAFLAYLSAFQNLSEPPPAADDRRLRERIIEVARLLEAEPVIPPEAKAHVMRAEELLAAEKLLGGSGTASSQAAAAELRQAISIAPWWPEATFKLASVLQKLQRVDEALLNLNLYRLADPDGFVARTRPVPAPVASSALAETPVRKPAGPAVIYVYWPEQQRGLGRQKVLCNERKVADLQNNRFVVLQATPGTVELTFRDRDVTAVVEAGREYHFRASIEGHWEFSMKPAITLTSGDVAAAEMRDKGVTSNDPRRTYGTDCTAGKSLR